MNQPDDAKSRRLTIAIQPQEEPLASIVKLIAEYGFDEVAEAISVAEIYIHQRRSTNPEIGTSAKLAGAEFPAFCRAEVE